MRQKLSLVVALLGLTPLACGKSKSNAMREPSMTSSAATVASAAAVASAAPNAAVEVAPAASAAAPGIEFVKPVALGEFLAHLKRIGGKGALVNAFASWCGPCREEVPMLESLSANLKRDGLHVVYLAFDEPEDRYKAEAFLRSNEVKSPSFLALGGVTFRERFAPNWPGMIPATFLFDANQKQRYFWPGQAFEHELMPIIEGFLAGKKIDGEANFAVTPPRTE
jgi:thiol-disulfide isomerase/thioredoxin